jgi:hypothetical protein
MSPFCGLFGKFDGMRGVDCSAPGQFTFEFLRDGAKVVGGLPGTSQICHWVENKFDFMWHGKTPEFGFVTI